MFFPVNITVKKVISIPSKFNRNRYTEKVTKV